MNPGTMDRQVVVEQYTTTRDNWNTPTKTWSTLATIWARKRDQRSGEVVELDQMVNLNRTLWTIRYRSDIDATMRIAYAGQFHYIVGIREIGRKELMEITTEVRD